MTAVRFTRSGVVLLFATAVASAQPRVVVEPVADVEPTGVEWREESCDVICFDKVGPAISDLRAFGDLLAFKAFNHGTGKELWVTDGTRDGTRMVTDLCPGDCFAEPLMLGALGREITFSAREDGPGSRRAWASDGVLVRELGDAPSGRQGLELDGRIFASSRSQVWSTDGSTTEIVSSFPEGPGVDRLVAWKGGILVDREGHADVFSDLRPVGSALFEVLRSCRPNSLHSFGWVEALEEHVLFSVACVEGLPDLGPGLFGSDGTLAGTLQLTRFPPSGLVVGGDVAYFLGTEPTEGKPRIWRTDGTLEGTVPLSELLPGAWWGLELLRGRFLLVGYDNGREIRSFDLSTAEEEVLIESEFSLGRSWIVPATGHAILRSSSGLWMTDGTRAGTVRVFTGSVGEGAFLDEQTFLFGIEDQADGDDLWSLRVIPNSVDVPVLGPTGIVGMLSLLLVTGILMIAHSRRTNLS